MDSITMKLSNGYTLVAHKGYDERFNDLLIDVMAPDGTIAEKPLVWIIGDYVFGAENRLIQRANEIRLMLSSEPRAYRYMIPSDVMLCERVSEHLSPRKEN